MVKLKTSWWRPTLVVLLGAGCSISAVFHGYYSPSVWQPIGIGLAVLLVAILIAQPERPSRLAGTAALAVTGFWLWSLLSTTWGESSYQALLEAERWFVYATAFVLVVFLVGRNIKLGLLLIGAATLGILAVAIYLEVRLFGSDAARLFFDRRLTDPLGYVNGQASYFLLGVWPLVALAERTRTHVVAGLNISLATLLCGLALLGQARAVIPVFLITALIVTAVLPGRMKRLLLVLVISGGTLVALNSILHVYEVSALTASANAVHDAARMILIGSLAAGTLCTVTSWLTEQLGRRNTLSASLVRRIQITGLIAIVLIGGGVLLSQAPSPVEVLKNQYNNLTSTSGSGTTTDSSRYLAARELRYDYWRVAIEEFKDHPLNGVGAGNYQHTYFLERRTNEDVRQPHSLGFQALAELGLGGLLLLILFVAAVLVGFARLAKTARHSSSAGTVAVAAGGPFLLWFLHTNVDWLHLLPGVTGIALGAAAVLVATAKATNGVDDQPCGRLAWPIAFLAAIVFLAGTMILGRITAAEHFRTSAQNALKDGHPVTAIKDANNSLAFNGKAPDSYYVKSAALARLGDYRRAHQVLLDAAAVSPNNYVTWTLLTELALRRKQYRLARNYYHKALSLNYRDGHLFNLRLSRLGAHLR